MACVLHIVNFTGALMYSQHNITLFDQCQFYHLGESRPRGYKTFFMLNSVEHEIFPAHKC